MELCSYLLQIYYTKIFFFLIGAHLESVKSKALGNYLETWHPQTHHTIQFNMVWLHDTSKIPKQSLKIPKIYYV